MYQLYGNTNTPFVNLATDLNRLFFTESYKIAITIESSAHRIFKPKAFILKLISCRTEQRKIHQKDWFFWKCTTA